MMLLSRAAVLALLATQSFVAALLPFRAPAGASVAQRRNVQVRSMPNFSPEQMKQAAEAMKSMSPDQMKEQTERMMKDIENMSPEEQKRLKDMGMNPDLLKMSMKMMKANPGMLQAAQQQMAKMSPDQLAQASAMAQKQMNGMTDEQMEQIAMQSTPTMDAAAAINKLPVVVLTARDAKMIDALFTVASQMSTPVGAVTMAAFKALPPVAALCGSLPDDLSDADLAEAWAEAGSPETLDRGDFEKAWLALADVFEDDIFVEARRPPKMAKA